MSGTCVFSNPLDGVPRPFSNIHDAGEQPYTMLHSTGPFVAPNGVTWVSQGAYEQAVQLDVAKMRIEELEQELCALRFPVEGASGRYDEDNGMDVWPTNGKPYNRLTFSDMLCDFCETAETCLHVTDDYINLSVCHDCLSKMFGAFDKMVTR